MKGVLLAGGSGTRLYPLTHNLSKQMLPVYDKPLIYYSLSSLMMAGIRDVLVVSSSRHLSGFKSLLGNGRKWGMELEYVSQKEPGGIAHALILAEAFLERESCILALGDNLFLGPDMETLIHRAIENNIGATIFACPVDDPERYGVLELGDNGVALSIEEKPKIPKSTYAVTGFYVYDSGVVEFAKKLAPSSRNELEITDINKIYLEEGRLNVEIIDDKIQWIDTGTCESLLGASNLVKNMQSELGAKICCPEEIAWEKNWITGQQFYQIATSSRFSQYGEYLMKKYQSIYLS